MRRKRAKDRNGGGGGPNGGGGLFDSIRPLGDGPISLTLPTTCYRTPDPESDRKPSRGVTQKSKAAAA